jgi:hypothetical protein
MSIAALKQVLDSLDEKSHCEGTVRLDERLALELPDGDVGAADDPHFVAWCLEHAEQAPFGRGTKTVIDKNVRHAQRLRDRDKVVVHGFDPATILDEIAAVLTPRAQLNAKLTDVIVYPEGGKFSRHKDTPRTPDLIGTLVVGLPIEHDNGMLEIEDGNGKRVFDWSGKPDPKAVRWVALFSDVDHLVKPVTFGARVTLVYALTQTDRPRKDPTWETQRTKLLKACQQCAKSTEIDWPLMIACTRHVIIDGKHAIESVEVLRGRDRDVADALIEAGLDVVVRACVASAESGGGGTTSPRFPRGETTYTIHRLKQPLTPKVIATFDEAMTFAADPTDDEGDAEGVVSLAKYILDDIEIDRWLIREAADATLIHESYFSDSGDFGNEGYEALIYSLAALEVTLPKKKKQTR